MARALTTCTLLALIAVGCESCFTALEPPAVKAPTPASPDNAVVILDGKPVRLIPSSRVLSSPDAAEGAVVECTDATPAAPAVYPERPVKSIVIDPGHGGENVGAIEAGVCEREINLDIAQRVAELLRKRGLTVTMTRTDDSSITLEERAEVANVAQADLFISIHSNAASNAEASGVEIYYPAEVFHRASKTWDDAARAREMNVRHLPDGEASYDGDFAGAMTPARLALDRDLGRTLGQEVERELVAKLPATSRGVKPASYEVLRWTQCPAVLIEVGFLTNDAEREKLCQADYRARIAEAIADGVRNYSRPAEPAR